MHNTLQSVSSHLRQMEVDIISGVLRTTNKTEEVRAMLKSQRKILESYDDSLVGSVGRQIQAHSNKQSGLILWVNPGISLSIDPKPIHLGETLAYFSKHRTYSSTGYHVFDLYGLDEDTQYKRVLEFIRINQTPKVIEEKEFQLAEVVKVLANRYSNGIAEDTEEIGDADGTDAPALKDTPLVKLLKEVSSTARHVIEDIRTGVIATAPDTEFHFDRLTLSKSEVLFYYWRLTVAGQFCIMLQNFRETLCGPNDVAMEYPLMPTSRPSASNEGVVYDLAMQKQTRMKEYEDKTNELLNRTADYVQSGEEVVRRDGNIISAAPGPQRAPLSRGTKRKYPGDCAADRESLKQMTVPTLRALMRDENIRVQGGSRQLKKNDLIANIIVNTNYDE